MSIALVSQASSSGTNVEDATTGSFDSTGATLIVVAFNYSPDAPSPTITDSKSNTYTLLSPITTLTGANRVRLAYCESPAVGSGHTVTVDQPIFTAGYPALTAYAFSGAGAYDQSAAGDEEGGTSMQPGSITPSEDNCLLVVAGTHDSATTSNAVSGSFSTLTKVAESGSNNELTSAYKIQTTAGAENPTLSWTTFSWSATVMASFKAAEAGVTVSSASLNSAGDELTVNLSGSATITDATGWSIAFSNRASRTLAYTSGSGYATLKFSLAAVSPSTDGRAPVGTTCLIDYDADTGNVSDLADVTDQAVTNNSTAVPAPDLPQNLPTAALPSNWNAPADHTPANGAALQAIIDAWTPGEGGVIELSVSVDYGNIAMPETFEGADGNWIIIRCANYASLPAFSTSSKSGIITSSHDAHLATLSRTPSANGHNTLNISGGAAGPGAGYIRFIGIDFRMEGSYGTDVLAIVSTLTGGLSSAVDKLPHHLGFDRCQFSHANTMKGVQDALRLDADDSFVVGCRFPSLYGAGNDGSNATRTYNGHRILVQNNDFNCNGASGFTGDNWLTVVEDYKFHGNYHHRNSDWGTGHGNNKGSFEAKTGLRVQITNNVFDGQFAAAGFGAITIKAEGDGGPKTTTHVTGTGNKIFNCEQAIVILAGGSSNDNDVGPNSDLLFRDNLGFNLNTRGIQLSVYNSPVDAPMMRLTIVENTILGGFFVSGSDDGLTPGKHLVMRDNVFTGLFGIYFVNGGAFGAQGFNYTWGDDYSVTYNLFTEQDAGNFDDDASPAPLGTLDNNLFPADIYAVGFTDSDNDDYSISNDSDYATASSTGGKPGYDAATYDSIWSAIVDPPPAPSYAPRNQSRLRLGLGLGL